ncbi:hypothetical protein [Brevibacterium samyangense]|uniref:DUF998 domain-containing protein n=1 Tax=Brevibacterium samyangense TaxID=366888 RepID=A0ABP5EQJ4_9MICO
MNVRFLRRRLRALPRGWFLMAWLSLLAVAVVGVVDMGNHLNGTRGWFPALASPIFDGGRDRGVGAVVGYVFLLVAAGALTWIAAARRGTATHVVLACGLLVLVADDSLGIHEYLGGRLAEALGLQSALALRGQDFGELLVWALLGIPLAVGYLLALPHTTRASRREALVVCGVVAVMAVVTAGLDMLGPAGGYFGWPERLRSLVSLAETVGKLATMALIMLTALAFAARAARRAGGPVEE